MDRKVILRYTLAALTLMVFAAVMVSGCAKNKESVGTTHSAEQGTLDSSVNKSETAFENTETSVEESRENPRIMPELKSQTEIGIMCGTVREAGMNSMVIANETYPDGVVFAKEDAAVSLTKGLSLDQEVTVFYSGKIDLSDSRGTMAELVRDPREGDEDRMAGVISGKVLSIGMSVITIRTKGGTEISFEQDPKPVNLTKGPAIEEEVTIVYSHKKDEKIYIPELILRK